jgi:uncharacterized protein YqhQ
MTEINKIKYNDIKSIIKFISYNALYTGIIIMIIMIICIILGIFIMNPIPVIIGSILSFFVFCGWIASSAVIIKIYLKNKKIE